MTESKSLRRRIAETDPLVIDTLIAVGLTVAACLLIHFFTSSLSSNRPPIRPNLPNVEVFRNALRAKQPQTPWLAYILAIGTFMPLALRRLIPWLALAVSGTFALTYTLTPGMWPMPVVFGPMLALYTFAALSDKRRSGLVALLVAVVIATVPVFAFSSSIKWVSELAGAFVMLAAAALLGEAARTNREYIAQVEARAVEAERTREEEALRRVDEERIRIAREVHDIVAHSLSIVTVQASAAETLLDGGDLDRTREALHNVRATGKGALTELRSMLNVLRTGESDAPLTPAADIGRIEALAESVREAGIVVDLRINGNMENLPAYAGVSAYRIVQEALTNVVRHASATHATVDLGISGDSLTITVTDDGVGSTSAEDPSAGHGLRGMRERAEALGGSFSATSLLGNGFRVSASIPITRSTS